jgi:bifunctional N-acetylglucosamine-1-phosphate-uridyltransferase/glucosamine-1-phosphate-acetyltransferase GlmU-like protein
MEAVRPAILVLGAGGHGKAVLDLLMAHGGWRIAGVVDGAPRLAAVLGVPVLGDEATFPSLVAAGVTAAHPAIGHNAQRIAAAARLLAAGFALPALVNTGAIVEHDCELGEGAHIAPGAVLAGGVRIGAGAMVGAGAVIRPGVAVGAGAIIGAGAAVLADVPPGATVAGVPAQPLRPEPPP